MRSPHRNAQALQPGFTLLELMIVVAIVAILSAIALPSYERYVRQSKAKSAASDLVALSLALENRFQKQLRYPTYADSTSIPAKLSDRKGTLAEDFNTWAPSQAEYFDFSITSSTSSYTITAQAKGKTSWCTLRLNERNERQYQDCSVLSRW